jgi:hypothetical protein
MKRVKDMTDDEVRDLPGGPYPEYAVQDTAERSAEAVRLLNYLSLPQDGTPGLRYPADVYDIVASLKTGVQRHPQLLSQLSGWLWAEHTAGRVAHDTQPDPADATIEARTALAEAESLAYAYAEALNRAHNAMAGLKANI